MNLEHRNLLIETIPALLRHLDFENLVRAVGQASVLTRVPVGASPNQATTFIVDAADQEGWIGDLIDRLATQFPNRGEFGVIKAALGAGNSRVASSQSGQPVNPWYEDLPLDFSREETRAVERLLVAVFSNNRDALHVAEYAGVDVSALDTAVPPKSLIKQILVEARKSDRLMPLIAEVLADSSFAAIHGRLRTLISGAKG
jgi:hypothetical protein